MVVHLVHWKISVWSISPGRPRRGRAAWRNPSPQQTQALPPARTRGDGPWACGWMMAGHLFLIEFLSIESSMYYFHQCPACASCSLFWTRWQGLARWAPKWPCFLRRKRVKLPMSWWTLLSLAVTAISPTSQCWSCCCQHVFVGRFLKQQMDVSKNRGTPKWMVIIMENPIKMDDLGGIIRNPAVRSPAGSPPHFRTRGLQAPGIEETKTFEPCPKTSKTSWESNVFF